MTETIRSGNGTVLRRTRTDEPISNLPVRIDLELYQGDDFFLNLKVSNPDGTPADMAAMEPAAQIRPTPEGQISGQFTASPLGDTIFLHLTHGQATMLVPGRSFWDCQITDPTGRVTTLAAGTVTTTAEITR
jgi:hypothetical protein